MAVKPILIPLDMSRAHENDHPDISVGKTYLARINGEYVAGQFHRVSSNWPLWRGVWYGWSFSSGNTFRAPGWDNSTWEQVWEIVDGDKEKDQAQEQDTSEVVPLPP